MATVKAVHSKSPIGRAIKYITKPEKTKEHLVSGYNCSPSTALEEMYVTKNLYNKTGGRTYKHFTQNFHPDDNVTPEIVHEIAKSLVKKSPLFKGFEVLFATHIDKDHLHTHFILNSVSFETGHKFQMSAKQLQELKDLSDELCRERGLHICEKGKTFEGEVREETSAYAKETYYALEKGESGEAKSYVYDIGMAIMECREIATSKEEFKELMEKKNIFVSWEDQHKYITFIDITREMAGEKKYKVRCKRLESEFNIPFGKEVLENEFKENARRKEAAREQLRSATDRGPEVTYNGTGSTGAEALIRELNAKERAAEQKRKDREAERKRLSIEAERKVAEGKRETTSRNSGNKPKSKRESQVR